MKTLTHIPSGTTVVSDDPRTSFFDLLYRLPSKLILMNLVLNVGRLNRDNPIIQYDAGNGNGPVVFYYLPRETS